MFPSSTINEPTARSPFRTSEWVHTLTALPYLYALLGCFNKDFVIVFCFYVKILFWSFQTGFHVAQAALKLAIYLRVALNS